MACIFNRLNGCGGLKFSSMEGHDVNITCSAFDCVVTGTLKVQTQIPTRQNINLDSIMKVINSERVKLRRMSYCDAKIA